MLAKHREEILSSISSLQDHQRPHQIVLDRRVVKPLNRRLSQAKSDKGCLSKDALETQLINGGEKMITLEISQTVIENLLQQKSLYLENIHCVDKDSQAAIRSIIALLTVQEL